ncbi:molybdate transport system ATP-binding protein [Mobilisporobacter senegalensis]|uniref:Molybdate transport system ATP-binding protein n=1 Tax=Mobilisporobacter senegalensis TaxID=1329262 RepID=A0A3N1XP57_9FIRM|nr:ATP-binding cassette domain-containing protein [Mobilisporobacter senegalensis]ROR28459.1 molybdate transport system ATP-binding protein [Mobilisporobacter senegalensis]
MSLYVDIKKKYKGFDLDVSLENKGQRLGILGASGCGKSLTLKCIAGIEKPDEGKIVLNQKVLFDSSNRINLRPQKRKVGYMFQNYALFPNMTVAKNIEIGIERTRDKHHIVEKMINLFQLDGLENRYPYSLSGGQQQRVALARILAFEPEVLLLDEPFSAMDSYLKEQLQQELLEVLKKYEVDTLIVSHSRDEIYKLCNNMAIIEKGKMIELGNTKDIFYNPINAATARLTGCKNISKAYKISDFEVAALNWNIVLKTKKKVTEDITYVGIRAHDIRCGDPLVMENTMQVTCVGITETPFEWNVLLHNRDESSFGKNIWWKITKGYWKEILKEKAPNRISFPSEKLVLLK